MIVRRVRSPGRTSGARRRHRPCAPVRADGTDATRAADDAADYAADYAADEGDPKIKELELTGST